ncbi:unnamed protein product, partial [Brenthis ino]
MVRAFSKRTEIADKKVAARDMCLSRATKTRRAAYLHTLMYQGVLIEHQPFLSREAIFHLLRCFKPRIKYRPELIAWHKY